MRAVATLLLIVVLHSCGSGPENQMQHLMDSMRVVDSVYSVTRFAKEERLNFLLDSILDASFVYGTDLVYFHKYWGATENGNTNHLSVSVSETGYLYYTSTLDQQSRTYDTHNNFMLTSGNDSLYITSIYDSFESYDDESMELTSEHVTFDEYDDRKVAEFIVAHRNSEINVSVRFYDDELAS